jgi:hypothetical protein
MMQAQLIAIFFLGIAALVIFGVPEFVRRATEDLADWTLERARRRP